MAIDAIPHQELHHTHVVCMLQQTGCLLSESAASTDYTAVRSYTPCGLFHVIGAPSKVTRNKAAAARKRNRGGVV
jgi:hypothetical protein